MPLYQLWCDKCYEPYEILMKLEQLDEFNNGEQIKCPECGEPLRMLIAPPKIIRIN